MPRHTVLITDDHPLFRRGLRDLLADRFDVVGEAREGNEAVVKAVAQRPDVVSLEIGLPGMDGIEAARQIREQLPTTGVVVISHYDDDQHLFDAIRVGVCSYVVKDGEAENVLLAIQHAADGQAYLPPEIARRVLNRVAAARDGDDGSLSAKGTMPLSNREQQVLRLMGQGRRNREIGDELCISERTVGNHITNIYNKLKIFDRTQAIIYAIKKGLVKL